MDAADLDAGARTVTDIAEHMHGMRQHALAFQTEFSTGARGYFTPSEDDAVVRLWVSYHKARRALLELIDSLRSEVGQPSEATLAEFLIGYGAAVVLVDAARFLRDLFGKDTIVRRKLNEPFGAYGISAGSFDAIQMSLTAPGHALQIREANEFYDQHQQAIRALAEDVEPLMTVIGVIDELGAKTRVGPTRYLKSRIVEERRRFKEKIVQEGLLRAIYAVQEWGSRLISSLSTMPRHVPKIPDMIATELRQVLQPGDVFITRKEAALTNYFLPGFWPHAALCAGDGAVIESLKDGVRRRSLTSPFGNDAICLIRPLVDPVVVEQCLARVENHIGKPYDFDFDFTRADRLVCTEVIYRGYEGLAGIHFPLTRRAGRQTLSAEDLLNLALQKQHFAMQAVYSPQHGSELLRDERMIEVLRNTMEKPAV